MNKGVWPPSQCTSWRRGQGRGQDGVLLAGGLHKPRERCPLSFSLRKRRGPAHVRVGQLARPWRGRRGAGSGHHPVFIHTCVHLRVGIPLVLISLPALSVVRVAL